MPIDTKELMRQVAQIRVVTNRLVDEYLSGAYHSVFRGQGIEFEEVRPYQPGDEVIAADHEHPSGTIPWQYWQEPKGIGLVRPTLPLRPASPGEIVDVYELPENRIRIG